MSNIYIQEPPTNGKVLLKTTAGDIDIELWSKEAPKACRNFIQLCMEDYYSNTIFHRVVPEFIVQGGDPTGTGSGGESVYGAPFKDEFHSRLRFNRRGLVAMANAGPHDNGSQFFFTLGRADELNSKHTIFGKITGDTIYNMLRLAEVETDNDERPVNPHKIRSTEVLFNPFDDIIPRTSKKLKIDKTVEEVKKAKSKGTKNFSLLSFGEEAEEEEEEVSKVSQSMKGKSKSSHDLLKDDPHLSSVPAIESEKAGDSHDSDEDEEQDEYSDEDDDLDSDEKHQMKERIAQKLKKDTNLPVKKSTTEEEMEKKSSRRVVNRQQNDNSAPCKKNKKTLALKLGTWNVGTMTSGLSDDFQEIDGVRKTAVIDMELSRLQMDIVALQVTKLSDSGSIKERNFSFFWQGKPSNEIREYGVGFAVRNTLLGSIIPPTAGSERILSLQLHTSAGLVTLISADAPTLSSSAESKDKFYDDLAATVKKIPKKEPLFILGNFNARVGSDHSSWPTCLGHFGVGKMNENGQRLLEFCCYYGFCVSNTFFNTKPQHRVSWRHPRSKHWHQLDLILTRRSSLPSIRITRSYHSADCDTDHSLVCSKVKLQAKRLHHSKKEGKP